MAWLPLKEGLSVAVTKSCATASLVAVYAWIHINIPLNLWSPFP
jgi:hypothetical protein